MNADILLLEFPDGAVKKIASVTYDTFERHIEYQGFSDTEYDKFLREKQEHELTTFNDSLQEAILVIKNEEGRELRYKLISDTDFPEYTP